MQVLSANAVPAMRDRVRRTAVVGFILDGWLVFGLLLEVRERGENV